MRTTDDPDPIDELLAISALLTSPRLARLYTRLYTDGPAAVGDVADEADVSLTTVYDDVSRLEELGTIEAIAETYPRRYRAIPVELTVESSAGQREVTPTLIAAVARCAEDDELSSYRDRYGVGGLATALGYAQDGGAAPSVAQRMARELGQSADEVQPVVEALQDAVQAAEGA